MRTKKTGIGLTAKIAVVVVIVVGVSTILQDYFLNRSFESTLVDRALVELELSAVTAQSALQDRVDAMIADTAFLAGTPPVRGLLRAHGAGGIDPVDGSLDSEWRHRLTQIFVEILRSKRDYEQARFVQIGARYRTLVKVERDDADGKVRVASTAESDRFRTPQAASVPGASGVANLTLEADPSILSAIVSIRDIHDRQVAVLILSLNLDRVLSDIAASSSGYHTLYLTESGNIVAAVTHDDTPSQDANTPGIRPLSPGHPLAPSRRDFVVEEDDFGRLVATSNVDLPLWPEQDGRALTVKAATPPTEITSATQSFRDRSVLLTLAVMFAAFVLGAVATRAVTKPVRQMIEAVQNYGSGVEGVSLPLGAKDEAGRLANVFAEMLEQVNERTEALESEITERARIEEHLRDSQATLRESEAKFRSLYENVTAGVFQTSLDGRLISANPALLRMLGYEDECELMEVSIADDIYVDPARRDRTIAKLNEDGEIRNVEVSLWRKDGRKITVLENAFMVRDEHGGDSYIEGTLTDITGLKNAEESRRVSELRYERLYHNTPVMLHSVDADGCVTSVNEYWLKTLGFDEEEVIGTPSTRFLTEESRELAQTKAIPLLRRQGSIRDISLQMVTKSGIVIDVMLAATARFDDAGEMLSAEASIVDVTDLMLAQNALRFSEERFRNLYNETPVMLHSVDLDGRISGVNAFWLRKLGYTEDEVIGKASAGFFDDSSREYLGNQLIPEISRSKVVEDVPLQMITKAGETIRVLMTMSGTFNGDGVLVQVQARTIDITERARAERRVRKTEERYRTLVDTAPFCIHEIDTEGLFLSINPKGLEMMGLSESAQVVGKPYLDAVWDEDKSRVDDLMKKAFAGETSNFDFKAGPLSSPRVYSSSFIPIIDKRGNVTKLMGITRDVTERYAARRELSENKEFYEHVLDSVPMAIAYVDADRRFRYMNKVYEDWFKTSREQVVGKSLDYLVSEENMKVVSPRIDSVLTGQIENFQTEVPHDDQTHHLDTTYLPNKGVDDTIVGFFSVVQDRTDHQHLEAKLRQAQKMEAVGQLTGGIAHDFNNLLSVILGNLQLIERPLAGDERLSRQVRTALRAAFRGADLTRRLLAFSRQQLLEPKDCVINTLVEGMDEMLRRTLSDSVQIGTVFADEPWPVTVDKGQLENALLNLAINARDAMPDGGRLTIETANCEFDETMTQFEENFSPGDYVMLSVSDTGMGIPAEMLDQVFEPFFTTKEVGKGSGLGLSMVYGFVEQSGGHVRVYSEVGVGTSIKLYFPRSMDARLVVDSTGTVPVMPTGTETILVVEDDADVRETTISILETLGYNILEACDGPSALKVLAESPDIDLLFTDVNMPGGMRGPVLARRAVGDRPDLKVLFTTGFSESAIMHRGEILDSSEILGKPYRNTDLARKVRAVLDQEIDATPAAAGLNAG